MGNIHFVLLPNSLESHKKISRKLTPEEEGIVLNCRHNKN